MTGQGVQLGPEKQCEEKARLMAEYAAAVSEFSRTLNLLNGKLSELLRDEHDEIWNFTEQACGRSEAARLALKQHIHEHGC